MKRVAIQGSTGSIGISTLDVIAQNRDRFDVYSLIAGGNISLLADQARSFNPAVVSVKGEREARGLKEMLGEGPPAIVWGENGIERASLSGGVDIVVAGATGIICLESIAKAAGMGKRIALANKELLVAGGNIIMQEAARSGAEVIPVDSEHSAIFQALSGHRKEFVKRLILCASGGPFFFDREKDLSSVTVDEALDHPVWRMGSKISVDSATAMNKGYEIIEAMHLFGISPDRIEVIIHPQSIVHSMVEFSDGSIIAQLGVPDMRIPIGYALAYPERLELDLSVNIWESMNDLSFYRPDLERFPSLALAIHVAKKGGILPAVMSTANDVAVEHFVEGRIKFTHIYRVTERVVSAFERAAETESADTISNIRETIARAKDLAVTILKEEERKN
ncbi:MAG: 1-deoxy-D-xylulose-5-phosphate reductoisomerase [Deltaproteobacteria bacterium]|nr:1-deoxy-D-xylulose-5-phosphate reductoisomerase [Deltaproteobacteria bacterium]NIS78594.1 1-deoxy-D-xylulose-5-phosphate reductoisomerase [Deltaproteobacteria bacterium]